MSGTIFVSGGSGYIAGYIIRQLVADGWMVHTSVRDMSKENEVRSLLAVDNNKIKFFAADLMDDAGWVEAMTGCSHVAHVASPLASGVVRHEDDLIVPARDGALRALKAAKKVGVRRFVMTSSGAAIAYGHGRGERIYTEADWTNINHPDAYPYVKSKTIAERAARDWIAAEGGDMIYCSVNPSAVLGPVWGANFSDSIEIVKRLLEGAMPGCPDFGFGIVDVRDLAALHILALNADNMAGERFIASGPFLKMIDVAKILKTELGTEARKVPTRKLPTLLVKISALFDPMVKQVIGELGNIHHMDGSHTKEVLGWETRSPRDSIIDTARSLIDTKVVKV